MTTPPWEADRPLTLEGARDVLEACFPDVDARGLKHLGSGWEFDTFLTGDGWVFRFPRRSEREASFDAERRVHELVAEVLPSHVALPTVRLVGGPAVGFPYKVAGHRYIAGVGAGSLDAALLPTFAREVAAALGALHSIPEGDARAAGVVEPDLESPGRLEWVERGIEFASGLRDVDPAVDAAVTWAAQVPLPVPPYEGPLRLIHHDLTPEHLVVEEKTGRLAGILDWTDAALGDAARDFVVLVTTHGWGCAEEVLRHYRGPVDPDFRERLGFMARLLSVIWLAETRRRGRDLTDAIDAIRHAFADPAGLEPRSPRGPDAPTP